MFIGVLTFANWQETQSAAEADDVICFFPGISKYFTTLYNFYLSKVMNKMSRDQPEGDMNACCITIHQVVKSFK